VSGGTARRMRPGLAISPAFTVMTEVVCGECGVRFHITHRAPANDGALAARQAVWLADKFVWDHIQENKHRASIELPEIPAADTKDTHE